MPVLGMIFGGNWLTRFRVANHYLIRILHNMRYAQWLEAGRVNLQQPL